MNKNIRLTQQAANAISGYLEAVKQMTGLSYTQIISQRLQADLTRDPYGLGGRWSAKASERRAARRAERKAAEAASPAQRPQAAPQEPEERVWRTGEEWTSSEDYKAVSAAVRAVWAKADMEGRERINRLWSDVREDEQAACDFLHTLQKTG